MCSVGNRMLLVPCPSGRLPCSAALGAGDDLQIVSYINSRLASLPASERSGSSGSGAISAEMRQWEVRWGDIQVERLVGSGSFGRVFAGRWHETPVAVKLLLGAGQGGVAPACMR